VGRRREARVTLREARSGPGRIRIEYDDLGAGEPAMLMMPGWCAPRSVFDALATAAAISGRVLVVDWRGTGRSEAVAEEYGEEGLVEDALAVLDASGAQRLVPVALAHAGWVAIELARRLAGRVAGIVLVDWLVLGAPPPFREALADMQDPEDWRDAVDGVFELWTRGASPRVTRFVREEMGRAEFSMWARAARAISTRYKQGRPLDALARLAPHVPTLHLCVAAPDSDVVAEQRQFAEQHPWFEVAPLEASSHFPMLEVPDEMAESIARFRKERCGS
jgi:pimeloyl-ACP methyl ester carboxylesterase